MQEIKISDIPILMEIYNHSFPSKWKNDDFTGLLSSSAVKGYLIEDKSFILFQEVSTEAEIITIATHPNSRGKGMAKQLLNQLKQNYHKIFLEVNEINISAISLYKNSGFIQTGIRKKYYDNKNDAIMMEFKNL